MLAVLASTTTLFAWDYEQVQIGDLYYNLDSSNKTAEVTTVGDYNDSGLTTATIPASVIYNSVTYSVTSIRTQAFYNCKSLTSIEIPNSVTSIGERVFCECSGLTSVTIPNSVTSIGVAAFRYCSGLTSPLYNDHVFAYLPATYSGAYTIPDGIESLAGGAFADCSGLTSVTIPNSVTSIGDYTFSGCSNLTSITCEAVTPPSCGENVFYNVPKTIPLYVPAESMDDYKAADQWKDFGNNILPIQTTAIDQITIGQNNKDQLPSTKVLRNGQIFILRGEKVYNAQGALVK